MPRPRTTSLWLKYGNSFTVCALSLRHGVVKVEKSFACHVTLFMRLAAVPTHKLVGVEFNAPLDTV